MTGPLSKPYQDEWQKTFDFAQRRDYEVAMATQKRLDRESAAGQARRDMLLQGFGWLAGTALVVALLAYFLYSAFQSADGNRAKVVELERERTEQVGHCVSLDQPAERQLCLMALGGDKE